MDLVGNSLTMHLKFHFPQILPLLMNSYVLPNVWKQTMSQKNILCTEMIAILPYTCIVYLSIASQWVKSSVFLVKRTVAASTSSKGPRISSIRQLWVRFCQREMTVSTKADFVMRLLFLYLFVCVARRLRNGVQITNASALALIHRGICGFASDLNRWW